ncbi:MAG TPA: phosphate ABC transporter permease PstA [Candidatus Thermoplasmatota archaeon]|nr:phosphate ABC transporter permease PstA [Candidatus Thermoplasmatota archaeon]
MDLFRLPARRRVEERVARVALLGASSVAVIILGWLLWRVGSVGLPLVDAQFLTSFVSRTPEKAGIKAALVGSLWLAGLTMAMALPVGLFAGIWLNEYAREGRVRSTISLTIANLAGVPSVVFGLLGLAVFVRAFGLGYVLLAGAMTLALVSLPVIIIATEEALKAVPGSMREAAYGLGATKWQVTKDHVLPYAMPGILTGSILALARAVGETAPLIMVGGASAVFFLPEGPMSLYTALPLQTFYWAANPKVAFRELAAAGTVVLLAFILVANLAAILLRNHYARRYRW